MTVNSSHWNTTYLQAEFQRTGKPYNEYGYTEITGAFEFINTLNFNDSTAGVGNYKLSLSTNNNTLKNTYCLGYINSYRETISSPDLSKTVEYYETKRISPVWSGESVTVNIKVVEKEENIGHYYDSENDEYIVNLNYKPGDNYPDYHKNLSVILYGSYDGNETYTLRLWKEEEYDNKQLIENIAYGISAESDQSATILATTQLKNGETNTNVQLQAFLPIPYYNITQNISVIGQNIIYYDSFGTKSLNNTEVFEVFGNNANLQFQFSLENKNFNKKYVPKDLYFKDNVLYLPSIAPAEVEEYEIMIKQKRTDELQIILAKIPLLLFRNTYGFQEVNSWSGETSTTKDYVMSPMVVAGSKNDRNEFSGVMMGTHSKFSSTTGLYGFRDGIATFGFSEDGSAFLGAEARTGRIEFRPDEKGGYLLISAEIDRSSYYRFEPLEKKNEENGEESTTKYYYPLSKITSQAQFKEAEFKDWSPYVNDIFFSGLIFKNFCESENGYTPLEYTTYLGRTLGYMGPTVDNDGDYGEGICFRGPTFTIKETSTKSIGTGTEVSEGSPFIFIHAKRGARDRGDPSQILLSTSHSDAINTASHAWDEGYDNMIDHNGSGAYVELTDIVKLWGSLGIYLRSKVCLDSKTPIYFNYDTYQDNDFIERTSDSWFQIKTTSKYLRITIASTYYEFKSDGIYLKGNKITK